MLLPLLILVAHPPVSGDACAHYRAIKSVPLRGDVEVVGRSCSMAVAGHPDDQTWILEVRLPAESLDSGHRRRDRHLARLLNTIRFRTRVSKAALEELLTGDPTMVAGTLELSGGARELELRFERRGLYYKAETKVRLTQFGLKPPSLGPFGWGGKVHDEVVIGVRLTAEALRHWQDDLSRTTPPSESEVLP